MMGKKKLSEIKAEVAALLKGLPGPSPQEWLEKEKESATGDRNRDFQALEALCAALEREARKGRKTNSPKKGARTKRGR